MGEMRFGDDWSEFLRSLGRNRVEYLLVGGLAVAFHGFPRHTGDLDVWVRCTPGNAARALEALREFGFDPTDATLAALTTPGRILRMGYPPLRIELLTSPSGVEFETCSARADTIDLDGQAVPVIALPDLIANKRAAARPKDLIDVQELERIAASLPPPTPRSDARSS